MTLTDILDLQKEVIQCSNIAEVQNLLDDNGEDNDLESAERVYHARNKNAFVIENGRAFLNSREIACPDCKNAAPDKILSNAVEVLSADENAHFGCCECGTMFQ